LHGAQGVNLGGPAKPPAAEAVARALGVGPEAADPAAGE